jgi:hypothetical protein
LAFNPLDKQNYYAKFMIFYLLVITVKTIEKTDIIFQKIKIKTKNELDKIMDFILLLNEGNLF